ncbi:Mth938-like domain-containing protein [Flavobacterium sp. MXW15]|uniref:Mth938-like domain-containing protein n=1 Tax=Xanthomonas chitinilytica TaxID=2989819 RepID=A0ABT3JZZ5_9XANT|nr:Mth938-like domain-containing protein [Xanthomonas sp. H13-6]MCW4456325.1 Mth938-like domain-containing protein [Flavobacterium sp. MXW15]MCW4474031.1 Mth938-like domain-containing protein [Xanthomonas sp. H13-6]
MQLSQELPDYSYTLRAADGGMARVNERTLTESFILTPDTLVEQWPVRAISELTPDHLQPLLALNPALVLLGTGERQVFPPAAVMATCLTRGIGIEVMTNAAAARTYNVLASEGRRVVVALLLDATTAP